MAPNSPEWQSEAERYDINAIIVPLGRYWGLDHFPVLRQFCASDYWRPVYLDETSAVFVRHTPATESLINRLQINCDTAPIPAVVPTGNDNKAFNQWANAAAVLNAVGRAPEALAATSKAMAIFPDSGSLRFERADLYEKLGDLSDAEHEYLASANLAPDSSNWLRLGALYDQENRVPEAIAAWKRAIEMPSEEVFLAQLSLGFDYLNAGRTRDALDAFDHSQAAFREEKGEGIAGHEPFYATLAHGRSVAWKALGDVKQAVAFEEDAVRLAPDRSGDWLELAQLYNYQGRTEDALRAQQQAATDARHPPATLSAR
jgi:tetratricopeptide (TPR) repeat protein